MFINIYVFTQKWMAVRFSQMCGNKDPRRAKYCKNGVKSGRAPQRDFFIVWFCLSFPLHSHWSFESSDRIFKLLSVPYSRTHRLGIFWMCRRHRRIDGAFSFLVSGSSSRIDRLILFIYVIHVNAIWLQRSHCVESRIGFHEAMRIKQWTKRDIDQ